MKFGRGWMIPAWSLELRQLLSYRADFWIEFLGSVLINVALAYYLWQAVFDARDVSSIGGMGIEAMVLYYTLVPLIERITRGHEMGFLSTEIYDGTLTRYLVFPVGLFSYKYVRHLAISTIALVQFGLIFGGFMALRGVPEPFHVTIGSVAAGLCAALAASLLYFFLASCLEMVAFWADNVWSLLVMLRFGIRLLGGGMIPLALFPDQARTVIELLPFASLLSFPIRTILGQVGPVDFVRGMFILVAWTAAFGLLATVILRRGTRQYTGVGI